MGVGVSLVKFVNLVIRVRDDNVRLNLLELQCLEFDPDQWPEDVL